MSDLNYLKTRTSAENEVGVTIYGDVYAACQDAHAIAVLTEWDEFKSYDWEKIYAHMNKPAFVFDGRNLLDREKLTRIGFKYQAIGS